MVSGQMGVGSATAESPWSPELHCGHRRGPALHTEPPFLLSLASFVPRSVARRPRQRGAFLVLHQCVPVATAPRRGPGTQ